VLINFINLNLSEDNLTKVMNHFKFGGY